METLKGALEAEIINAQAYINTCTKQLEKGKFKPNTKRTDIEEQLAYFKGSLDAFNTIKDLMEEK